MKFKAANLEFLTGSDRFPILVIMRENEALSPPYFLSKVSAVNPEITLRSVPAPLYCSPEKVLLKQISYKRHSHPIHDWRSAAGLGTDYRVWSSSVTLPSSALLPWKPVLPAPGSSRDPEYTHSGTKWYLHPQAIGLLLPDLTADPEMALWLNSSLPWV